MTSWRSEGASSASRPTRVAKIENVRVAGIEVARDHARRPGVPMAYGTDLLGEMHRAPVGGVRHPRPRAAGRMR